MRFLLLGDHCPITGNLVTARVVGATDIIAVPGSTVTYAEGNDYAVLEAQARILRLSVTNRKAIKARKKGK